MFHHRQNLSNKNSLDDEGGNYYDDSCSISLGSDLIISVQDESRTEIIISNTSINNEEEEEEATTWSSSKDIINHHHQEINFNKDDHGAADGSWLQLSLGSGHVKSYRPNNHQISLAPRLVELDLLPAAFSASSSGETTLTTPTPPPPPQQQDLIRLRAEAPTLFLQQRLSGGAAIDSVDAMTFSHHQQYHNNYIMPIGRPDYTPRLSTVFMKTTLSSPPSLEELPGSQPLHLHTRPPLLKDFRVVDPPSRPHSGVWFILQASQIQTKEPYLPQVPKRFLRIKDGTTPVRLLIKYLVNKLKLDSKFEIEITCRGQPLSPFLTLQHVRDNIWNRLRNDGVFPHFSTTIDHLMVLNYGRTA